MPVNKEEAYRALELLEDYYNRLSRPQDKQLRSAIERVIQVFKSRLFQALIDIQEYYEVTLLDEGKTLQQKTSETNQVATRWERPATNNVILPPSSFVQPEEPLPSSTPSIMVGNDVYAVPMKTGPKLPPPPADGSASSAPPPVAPKPKTAPKPSKPPIEVDLPPEPPSVDTLNAQDPDWEYEEVVLNRGSASLGISIAGGTDNPHLPDDPSVVITRIVEGGFVANDGRLRVDDIILSVNGVSMVGVTHTASVDALKNAGKVVTIRVKRPKGVEEALLEIDLIKGSKGLGFSIAGGIGNQHIPGDNGIFITKITDGGAAQVDGRLMVGDRLIFVNEANLENVDHDAAVAALKATSKNVKLVVGRASYSQVDGAMPPPPPPEALAAITATEPIQSMTEPLEAAPPPPPVKPKSSKKPKSKAAAEAVTSNLDPRTIVLHRGPTGLGFNIVGGEDGEGIFVSLIQPGGQADVDGQLQIGDRLLSVNGTDLREATHEQAASVLKRAGDVVEIVAHHQPTEYALFDAKIRDLREQLLNTSSVPADTSRGKQLNVSAGADTSRGGKQISDALDSSKTKHSASGAEKKKKHKSKFYVRALFDFDPANSSDIPGQGLSFFFGDILYVTNSSGEDWWQAKSVVPAGSDTCYIPSKLKAADLERARIQSVKAQRGEKKKKKKGKDRSVEGTEDEADEKVLTYELVAQQEVDYARPVIILGALKDRLNDDLITEFPEKYGSCVPHTTRPQREHEVHGRDYYFVESREQMEKDIENQLFVEAGQFNGNLYGTSIQSVQDVAYQGRHCILDVGAAAIKRLQNSGIQPIAIFLKPSSPDNIIQWMGNLSDDQARKQYERALKMEDEFGEQFTAMVYGQTPEEVYEQVKVVIESHAGRVAWVATNQPL